MTTDADIYPDDLFDTEGHPDLPMMDVAVEAHLHFGMTGSFPLRMAELFFTDDGLQIAEYSYITPLFGLAMKQPRKDARAMQVIYDRDGMDGVLLSADRTLWINYRMLERLVLHSGGHFGHPKLTAYTKDRQSYAYRLHDDVPFERIEATVRARADAHDIPFEARRGLGFTPRENIVRFFGHP